MNLSGEDRYSKRAWRRRLVAARELVPASERERDAAALAIAALSVPGDPICAYLPIGTEPGTISLVDALLEQGRRVLLPIVTGREPLDWADYRGPDALVDGPFGLREPAGPRLGPAAIGGAGAMLIPALAMDRTGTRLGRGVGHYDRSLALAAAGIPLVGVVRDAELVDLLPAEPHDVRLNSALTPGGGWVRLAAVPEPT